MFEEFANSLELVTKNFEENTFQWIQIRSRLPGFIGNYERIKMILRMMSRDNRSDRGKVKERNDMVLNLRPRKIKFCRD